MLECNLQPVENIIIRIAAILMGVGGGKGWLATSLEMAYIENNAHTLVRNSLLYQASVLAGDGNPWSQDHHLDCWISHCTLSN